jgi:hypothetical protein
VAALLLYALLGFFVVPPIARGQIEEQARARLHREATVARVRFNPFRLAATVEGLNLKDRDGADLLRLDRFYANLELSGLFRRHWRLRQISVEAPRLVARIAADGRLSVADLFEPKPESKPPAALPRIIVDELSIRNGSAELVDETRSPRYVETITPLDLTLHGLSTIPDRAGDHSLTLGLPADARIHWSGRQTLEPLKLEGTIRVEGVTLSRAWDYFKAASPLAISEGKADLSCAYEIRRGQDKVFAVAINDIKAAARDFAMRPREGGDPWVALPLAEIQGASVTWPELKIHVPTVTLDGVFAKIAIDREGRVNLKEALGKSDAGGKDETTETAPAEPEQAPSIDVGVVAVHNASADYTDESLILPFHTKIQEINGSLKDLSTTSPAPATLGLEGRISETGYFKSDGSIRLSAPFADTDVALIFRRVVMAELTPYCAEFAGYSIQQGTLDVDVRYRIHDGTLNGDHRVVATDLTLGPKVEGAKGQPLPIRLAVALLKDKNGRIDLEVPVSGTPDSPQFDYKAVCWQAVKTILGNVVAAPFRALGGGADDLELVGFAPGRADLPAPNKERLGKIGANVSERPELSVAIEGRYDPTKDAEAMRAARLERRIDAKRQSISGLPAIVEALFVETFSAERLAEERRKHPTEAGAAAFYDALRAQLLAAEVVTESELVDLARARGTALAAAITAPGGLDPARVKVSEPAVVKPAKQGTELVLSDISLSAGD